MAEVAPYKPKLDEAQQLRVCSWIAQYKTPKEVQTLVKSEFGVEMAYHNVYSYSDSTRWKPVIEKLRSEWAAGIMAVPIANMRFRLEKLQDLMKRAEESAGRDSWAKRKEIAVYVKQASEELKETKVNQTNITSVIYMGMSEEQLKEKAKELMAQIAKYGGVRNAISKAREVVREAVGGEIIEAESGGEVSK